MTAPQAADGRSCALNLFISAWEPAPGWLPDGMTAWAIGDTHGHLDHLETLLEAVRSLAARSGARDRRLVMMGDYVDRGPHNLATLARAADPGLEGIVSVALWGNHDTYLDTMLNGAQPEPGFLDFWIANGALPTLRELGVDADLIPRLAQPGVVRAARAATPGAARRALESLRPGLRLGGYVFVHGGVDPHAPFEGWDPRRQLTMREPFLSGRGWVHPFAVVHGHTIAGPDIFPHRIAVDSGVYLTGVLTCVELRGREARFICATPAADLQDLQDMARIARRRPLAEETWRPFPV